MRCTECGSPNGRAIERSPVKCPPCYFKPARAAVKARRQLDELLGLGVNVELAREVIVDRIARGDYRL